MASLAFLATGASWKFQFSASSSCSSAQHTHKSRTMPVTSVPFTFIAKPKPKPKAEAICMVSVSQNAPTPTQGSKRLADMLDPIPPKLRKACLALPPDATIVPLDARSTKIVATIGPSTSSPENLLRLAAEGANLIRLNMSHGDYEWHRKVIQHVRRINEESPFVLGTILDVGSLDMVRLGEFSSSPTLEKGDLFTLTVRHEAAYEEGVSEVSYDGFIDVVAVGDLVQIDSGTENVEMLVKKVTKTDAVCQVSVGGTLRSRSTIMIRGKSYFMDAKQNQDTLENCVLTGVSGCHPMADIEFGISEHVDYISLSFVESADIVNNCRNILREKGSHCLIIAKIESQPALENIHEIVRAADAIMIARGDLGTAIPFHQVPVWQERITNICRELGKPCLVSTHFLESMTMYPTPTRAEVTDISEAVSQRADALILTSETASGKYPFKSLAIMHAVAKRMEEHLNTKNTPCALPPLHPDRKASNVTYLAENIASAAAILANQRKAKAILVFTQKGLMANLVSRCRPAAPIFAFTAAPAIRNKLSLLYGVRPLKIQFLDKPEDTVRIAFEDLKSRQLLAKGDLVIVVADVLGESKGAPIEDAERVFAECSRGTGYITQGRVRAALRKLGLKVSDAVEATLGMKDLDLEESTRMELARATDREAAPIQDRIDFEYFKRYVDEATEVVHTVQLRFVE